MQYLQKHWRHIAVGVTVVALAMAVSLFVIARQHSRALSTPANNILANPSFEALDAQGVPVDWQVLREGGTPTVKVSAEPGNDGPHALGVVVDDYVQGNVTVLSSKATVRAGERYRFNAMYRTHDGLDLVAYYYFDNGTQKRQVINHFGSATDWTSLSGSIAAEQGVSAVAFGLQLTGNSRLDLDAAYAVADPTASLPVTCDSANNLIPNSDLQTISGAWPLKWESFQYGNNVATNQLVNENHNIYANSTITDFTDGQAKWVFVPIAAQEQVRYCFGLDYKAMVSTDVMARFVLMDGSVKYLYVGTLRATGDWTRASMQFDTPANVVSVQVAPELIRVGSIQTDNYVLSLVNN